MLTTSLETVDGDTTNQTKYLYKDKIECVGKDKPGSGGRGCAQAAGGVHPERPRVVTVDLAPSSTGLRVSSAHTFVMP